MKIRKYASLLIVAPIVALALNMVAHHWLDHFQHQSNMLVQIGEEMGPILGIMVLVFLILRWFEKTAPERQSQPILEGSLTSVVRRVVDSEEFASALRPTLPKGDDDEKYGFDHIPFLLRNIDERRIRFRRSSRLFLTGTILFGILFAGIVVCFGYILVDESAVGDPHRLQEIESHLKAISSRVEYLTPLSKNEQFIKICGSSLRSVLDFKQTNLNSTIQQIQRDIENKYYDSDLSALNIAVGTGISMLSVNHQSDAFLTLLKAAESDLYKFGEEYGNSANVIVREMTDLKQIVNQSWTQARSSDGRVAEILKRIAIGLVVCSFFLAVLRYIAGLYRENYRQMIATEQDDLAIRRFYVAFRCASQDANQRIQVLTAFLTGPKGATSEKDAEATLSPQSQELFKEVLSVLAKKAGV